MVFATLLILSVIVYSKREIIKAQYIDFLTVFALVLFIFTIVSFAINAEDINGQLSKAMWLNRIGMFLAPLISLMYFAKKLNTPFLEKINEHKYLVLLFISLIIQVTLLRIVKVPDIDVYQVLRFGPPRLLSLQNPYKTGATVEELKNTNSGYSHYAYGPTTIFLFLPFDILFGEPRYLLIIANFLCAFALYKISQLINNLPFLDYPCPKL